MTDYGVQPTGFVRKPLSVIKADMEAMNRAEFGSNVIQTPQSPLGQIVGILSEAATKVWELAEGVYQSYDPMQATGYRLAQLGRIRLVDRADGETEASYRRAITNAGAARIDVQDLTRAVAALDGVTYAHVFVNDDNDADDNGQPGGSLAVAVSGGDDTEIATAVRRYIAPGDQLFGNYPDSSVVDGYCRTTRIVRPETVSVDLTIRVRLFNDQNGCPPPSITVIADMIRNAYLLNGEDITHYRLRTIVESIPGIQLVSFQGERDDNPQSDDIPIEINFLERAVFDEITVITV